ncbi:MAG TPA: hypothetical protein VJ529_04270, partial [Candidatus Bathyarchaeia archaeon]|nr:hypothetical protein [Candidatus Bathyarchaeia archaeon]
MKSLRIALSGMIIVILVLSSFVLALDIQQVKTESATIVGSNDCPIGFELANIGSDFLRIDGTSLYMSNEEFCTIGANHADLIWSFVIPGSTPEDGVEIIEEASSYGIKVLRFHALGYNEWFIGLWNTDNETFWHRYDGIVEAAAANNVFLVPSLIWPPWQFSNVTGEHPSQTFVPNSTTNLLFKEFVNEIVIRYRNSTTILMWEIGNELNLWCERGPNYYSMSELQTFLEDTVDYIHQLDSNHLVESGMSI